MRIVTVTDTFFPDAPGGLARVAWDVAKAMARRGHEVRLLAGDRTVQERSFGTREETIDGVLVVRYPKPPMRRLDPFRDSKQIFDASSALSALLLRAPCDVAHCHSIFTAHAAMRAASGIPMVLTVHSPSIQELVYNWSQGGVIGSLTSLVGPVRVRYLEKRAITWAKHRHALSQFTVEQMRKEYPSSQSDYAVIPHWADPAWFRSITKAEARSRLGWPLDTPIIFTLRQLRRRYGIDTAIEAIAPLTAAGRCHFFIAGEGQEREKLFSLTRCLNTADRIRLLGRISDENLRLAYQAADMFVLPTRTLECFGLIILEALACGLPVIGTRVGAIPENLEPILPNCIVPPDDPAALRRKVTEFLDGTLPIPPVERLVEYVSHGFGESDIVGRYERLFEQTAGR
jgi:glycosyltransferase involved in cell wall biosynthesis